VKYEWLFFLIVQNLISFVIELSKILFRMKLRPFVTPAILILFTGNMVMSKPSPKGPTHKEEFTPQAEKYIKDYHSMAIQEMKRSMVPASITLAQGMLESGYGSSELANYANNHFGIKCHKGWTGETYTCKSGENTNGYIEAKKSCFRSYSTVGESFKDHSDFFILPIELCFSISV
jgi:flagellum-specific peptidoglycan hydrolase FlgJ